MGMMLVVNFVYGGLFFKFFLKLFFDILVYDVENVKFLKEDILELEFK